MKSLNKIATPTILMIAAPIVTVAWFIVNTDQLGTVLFGEKLTYCNVMGCTVTRDRFLALAVPLFIVFVTSLVWLIIATSRKDKDANAKD